MDASSFRFLTVSASSLQPVPFASVDLASRGSTAHALNRELPGFCLMRTQGLAQAEQILGSNLNQAVARGIDVSDQHERDGDHQRKNQK